MMAEPVGSTGRAASDDVADADAASSLRRPERFLVRSTKGLFLDNGGVPAAGRKLGVSPDTLAEAAVRYRDVTAAVRLRAGSGKVIVNGRSASAYFGRPSLEAVIRHTVDLADDALRLDVVCTVRGGRLTTQALALRAAILRALRRDARPAERRSYKQSVRSTTMHAAPRRKLAG